jgi:hypothetical protein
LWIVACLSNLVANGQKFGHIWGIGVPKVVRRSVCHKVRSVIGDRHLYASRTRFIPENLLGLFERTVWPLATANTEVRVPSQGPKVDIGARMRGMWR